MVDEARLRATESGLAPVAKGWFVVDVRDAAWETGPFGAACFFEGEDALFADLGINLRVHCPPGTTHAFVATRDGPCVIVMTGARTSGWPERSIVYPRSELARRHGAGVETETSSPSEAYALFPKWQPGRPDDSNLPWSDA